MRTRFGLLLLGIAAITAPIPLRCQTPLQRRPAPAPKYVLGPGDQLVLHIADDEQISDKPISIDPSGTIDLPMVGRLQAGGLTLEQLKVELVSKLKRYITNPDVSVNLSASGSQPVTVLGEVANPGVRQLMGSGHLLEVLSLSGGLKPDAGPTVIVTREPRWGAIVNPETRTDPTTGFSTVRFSLDDLMSERNPENNILIEPNDVITVPRAGVVYVVGDVQKAGGFQLSHRTMSLLQTLSLAEGLGPNNAAGRARILRQEPGGDGTPRQIPVDINKIVAGKAPDFQLQANDVLFVPKSGVKVVSQKAIDAAIGISTGLLIYRH